MGQSSQDHMIKTRSSYSFQAYFDHIFSAFDTIILAFNHSFKVTISEFRLAKVLDYNMVYDNMTNDNINGSATEAKFRLDTEYLM